MRSLSITRDSSLGASKGFTDCFDKDVQLSAFCLNQHSHKQTLLTAKVVGTILVQQYMLSRKDTPTPKVPLQVGFQTLPLGSVVGCAQDS